MYEGEYLNGKRHGKGKEYEDDNGKLIYEGEYLNGKRWTGKVYDITENGRIKNVIYELKDGKGFGHENNNDKYFIGEYLNGEKNGKGKEYYKYYLIYEGEYLNGKRHGKGREYAKNYLIFEGEYYNGKRWNGKTNVENSSIKYELKNGNGYSLQFIFSWNFWDEGNWLEGEYVNGELNGKAKQYDEDGTLVFEGEYLNGKKNGKFKEYYLGNIIFEGNYLYDQRIEGKKYFNNGKIKFEGEYLFDEEWNGKGYDEDGNIKYELKNGINIMNEKILNNYNNKEYNIEYCNDEKKEIRQEYDYGVVIFEGEYLNGDRNGKGKEYNECGKLKFEGEYLNGYSYGKGK